MLEKDIENWILNFVSVHNPQLNAVPCPFAKQAYIDNKILVRELKPIDPWLTMPDFFLCELENYTYVYNWPKGKDVIVLGCDPKLITPKELSDKVKRSNETFLKERGYVALEDHPDDPEIIAGQIMNQGSWALVLLQSAEKLKTASRMLEKQGYYDSWTKEQLDDVVNWR